MMKRKQQQRAEKSESLKKNMCSPRTVSGGKHRAGGCYSLAIELALVLGYLILTSISNESNIY